MTDHDRTPGAVFLSYAREDGEAARRIAEALRGFGVETWFDVSELRGGEAWDAKIRQQIRECALFIAVISANTQARGEGYFRREWKLAVERTHDMSESRAFIVPVVVDDHVAEAEADVPEQFLKVHFTRLRGGEPTPQFVEQVKRLLQGKQKTEGRGQRTAMEAGRPRPAQRGEGAAPPARNAAIARWLWGAAAIAFVLIGGFLFTRKSAPPAVAENTAAAPSIPAAQPPLDFANAKSIAVLPFIDLSQAKDQEYFSDGLAEELLDLLAKIPALHVVSRTSAFSFKGQNVELAEIARRLNVAHILEGSVRKSGNRLRITAQLIDARTDRHLWSETYDRSLDDIFAVQDEIAAAVVAQLKVALFGAAPKAKPADPKAYALFLQARQLSRQSTAVGYEQAIALYQQALAIDPQLAVSWAGLADCYRNQTDDGFRPNDEGYRLAHEAVNKALAIDPDLALARAQLGRMELLQGNLAAAAAQIEQALTFEPGNMDAIDQALYLTRSLNRADQGVALGEFWIAHDPVNVRALGRLGTDYSYAGRWDEAIASYRAALRLSPGRNQAHYGIGMALLAKGKPDEALAEMKLESGPDWRLMGLAMACHALGRKAQSDAAVAELIAKYEKDSAWNLAYVFAFRHEPDRAFEWLDKAIAYRDPGLSQTAIMWEFTSLHSDPRWLPYLRKIGQAPEQLAAVKFELKLPSQ